jgi:hypothetical protein
MVEVTSPAAARTGPYFLGIAFQSHDGADGIGSKQFSNESDEWTIRLAGLGGPHR